MKLHITIILILMDEYLNHILLKLYHKLKHVMCQKTPSQILQHEFISYRINGLPCILPQRVEMLTLLIC